MVGKSPGGRKWQPTPVSLPGKYHAQRSLAATAHGIAKTQLTTHACKPVKDSTSQLSTTTQRSSLLSAAHQKLLQVPEICFSLLVFLTPFSLPFSFMPPSLFSLHRFHSLFSQSLVITQVWVSQCSPPAFLQRLQVFLPSFLPPFLPSLPCLLPHPSV